MLKTIGSMYTNTKEEFTNLVTILENAGYEVAYINELQGTIIKEVESLDEN